MSKEDNKIYKGVVASAITLFISLLITIIVHYFEVNIQNSVRQSIKGSLEIKSILSLLKDAETGQRGFILTKKDSYLEPYNNSINSIYLQLNSLSKTIGENSLQQERLRSISKLVDQKIIELKKTISLFSQGKIEDAYSLINSDLGKNLMENIVQEINHLQSMENKILYKNQRTLDNLTYVSSFLKVIIIFNFIVLLIYARKSYSLINFLKDDKLRLNNVIRATTNGIIAINEEGIIQFANESTQQIFGYSENELIGQSIELLIPKKYHFNHSKKISEYISHGEKQIMASGRDVKGIKRDGCDVALEIGLSRIILANGSIQVIITIVDIENHNCLIEDLSKLNELHQAILNSSNHLIISTDPEGIVTQFNKSAEISLGYNAEDIVGKESPALWHDGEEVVKRAKELSEELNEHIEPGFEVFTVNPRKFSPESRQWTLIRKDKSTFPVNLTVTCIRNKENKVTGYLGIIEDITNRKQTEELLAASEEKFRSMYQNSPDGYLIMELDKAKITDCNYTAEKMLNGTKEQILGLTPDQLSPEFQPDGRSSNERVQENIEIIFREGSHRFDWVHKKVTGELFQCDVNISLINYEERQVLLVGWRDIEKQKKAEKELEYSRNFLKLIFDNSPSIIFVKDKNFRIVEANSRFFSIYPEDQQDKIIGYTTIESYKEDEAKEFLKNDQKAFDEGYSAVTEVIATPEGTKRVLYSQKVRFEDVKGNPFILGISSDVTEYEAELFLLQKMHSIISDTDVNFLDKIQRVLEEGCNYLDLPTGIVSEINNTDYNIFNVSGNDNLKPGMSFNLKDTYCDITYNNNEPFYSSDLNSSEYINHSCSSSLKSSTYIGARIIVDGVPFGTISFSDIKKRKKKFSNREIAMLKHISQWVGFKITQQNNLLEKNNLIEKLSDSNEELERFAFVCSHDLQEPLRMIRSFSEKLQIHMGEHFENDEKGKKYFRFITNGAEQAQDLIQDILAYSSIDNDAQPMEKVNPKDLIDVIKSNMQLNLEERDGKITYDELPDLCGNKTQFFQLFQNIINNGIKYQKIDSSPHVHVSVKDSGEYWQFSIKDNGIGMETRHLTKIFDVFKRLNKKSQYAGTGVGLSICKKVVQRHGGRIWVESKKDIGSTFYFTILKLTNIEKKYDN